MQDADLEMLIPPAALLEAARGHGQCDTPKGSPVFSLNPAHTSGVCSFFEYYSKEGGRDHALRVRRSAARIQHLQEAVQVEADAAHPQAQGSGQPWLEDLFPL